MALHDFFCQTCGRVLVDIDVPIALGALAGAPDHCGRKTAWIPQVGRMDAKEPFQRFETTDGRGQPVVIDSLHKLRQVERESEVAFRNGEGQPMIFRRWSQDTSNQDRHTLSPDGSYDGGEQPTPDAVRRFGKALRSAVEPELPFGPGVTEQNATALKGD